MTKVAIELTPLSEKDWEKVLAALAERFDEDPFLFFRLRGKTQEEILASLGTGEGEMETPALRADATSVAVVAVLPEYAPAPLLTESVENFWQIGPELESFAVHIAPPDELYPLLERLGEPDFFPEARRWLAKAYDGVSETAVQIAFHLKI